MTAVLMIGVLGLVAGACSSDDATSAKLSPSTTESTGAGGRPAATTTTVADKGAAPIVKGGSFDTKITFHHQYAVVTVTKVVITPAKDANSKNTVEVFLDVDNSATPRPFALANTELAVAGLSSTDVLDSIREVAGGAKGQGSLRYDIAYGASFGLDDLVFRPGYGWEQTAEVPLGKKGTLVDFPPIVTPISGTLTAGVDTLTATEAEVSNRDVDSTADRDTVYVRVKVTGSTTTINGAGIIQGWLKRPDGRTSQWSAARQADNLSRSLTGWPVAPATGQDYLWFQVPEDFGGTYTLTYNRDSTLGELSFDLPKPTKGWGSPGAWPTPKPTEKVSAWYGGGLIELLSAHIETTNSQRVAVVRTRLSADIGHGMFSGDVSLHTSSVDVTQVQRVGELPTPATVDEVTWRFTLPQSITSLDAVSMLFGKVDVAQVSLPLGKSAPKGWDGAAVTEPITGTMVAGVDTVVVQNGSLVGYQLKSMQALVGKRVLRLHVRGTTTTDHGAGILQMSLQLPDGSTLQQLDATNLPNAAVATTGWPVTPADRDAVFEFLVPAATAGAYIATYTRDQTTGTLNFTLK